MMKSKLLQLFIFLLLNPVFSEIADVSIPELQKSAHKHSIGSNLRNSSNISFDEYISENTSTSTSNSNTERIRPFSTEINASLNEPLKEKDWYFPRVGSSKNHFSHAIKRSLLSQVGDSRIDRKVSNFESSGITNNSMINTTILFISFPANESFSRKEYEKNGLVYIRNSSAIQTEKNDASLSPEKKINWFILHLPHKNNINGSSDETFHLHSKISNSDDIATKFQANGTFDSSLNNGKIDNWYTSPIAVIDIRTLEFNSHTRSEYNNSKYIPSKTNLNNSDNALDVALYNLMQNFNCVVEETILTISCRNISLYSIGEFLPNETSVLDISYSNQIKLLLPLFPHLKKLKKLTLSNNHHRYITKAFMGLENLEILDLSNNDIMALIRAFLYIPKLKVLNLSNNVFRSIKVVSNAVSHLSELQNLTLDHNTYVNHIFIEDLYGLKNCNLTLFSLFNTTVQRVEDGAFTFIPNLKILEISVNYMDESALANITCSLAESAEILFLGHMMNIKTFPTKAVDCLNNTRVRELRLRLNNLYTVPVLPNLPYLQLLSLGNCSLIMIETDAFMNVTNLNYLDLSGNKFTVFPAAINSAKNLKHLYLDYQNTYSYDSLKIANYGFQDLINLEILSLSRTSVGYLWRYNLFGLKNLKKLSLSLTKISRISDYSFETLLSLEMLDLRGNGIQYLSNFTFYGLRNLRNLFLNGNYIEFSSVIYPFQFSPLLSALLLHVNQVTDIPKGMFANLEHLEYLTLGMNKVLPWSEKILHSNAKLHMLELADNNIDYISPVMLTEFQQVNNYLVLSKNPFNCSRCGMKKFQSFCLNSNLTLKLPLSHWNNFYSCMYPVTFQNENFFDIELPEMCDLDEMLNALAIILTCSFMFAIILIFLFCYTFRWYIRYWIFHLKTNFKTRKSSFHQNNYMYDAFIIYSSADTPWVVRYLTPTLEGQEPYYKLCIHQRDFQVGRRITENILEAIENSRKVILILTESFIKSEWCLYELHLAQHKLFRDTRDILILVKLNPIDKKLYTKNISYIENTRKSFMWTESYIGQKLFWDQIRKQLGQPRTDQNIHLSNI